MTTVSALIPTYNRLRYVRHAIQSVLQQTVPVDEVIVIDDGSTDGTAEALRAEFGNAIRVVEQENTGVAGARAKGLAEATCEWVAFLDSDDEWTPDRNRVLKEAAAKVPASVAWLFGDTAVVTDDGEVGRVFRDFGLKVNGPLQVYDDPMCTQHPFQFSLIQSSMVRLSAMREVNAFSEKLRSSEDMLAGWKVAARYGFAAVPDVVAWVQRTMELAASSTDAAGRRSPDYHRARVIGYSILERSGRKGPWGLMHSDSVRRLCLKLWEQGETRGLRRLALQQFEHSLSPRAVAFMGAILFGTPGLRAWRWATGHRNRLVGTRPEIGILPPEPRNSSVAPAGMRHDVLPMSPSRQQPLVAIMIPVFNARPYLRAAVESVLAQTYQNLEVLVIDDGSTDGSLDVISDLRDPRLRVITQANAGKPAALNRAIAMTSAEFYAVNDADDLSHPERVERQVACLLAKPHLAGVFTGHELIVRGSRMAPQFRGKDEDECREDIAAYRMPGHDPTPMYRMSMVRGVEFDPKLPVAEGLDYILRVGEQYPFVVLDACLYSYRIHQASITKRARDLCNACVWEVLRRACKRRGTNFEELFGAECAESGDGKRIRNKDLDNNLAAHFIESVVDLRARGRVLDAIKTGLTCGRIHPTDPHYLKALAYAVLPQFVVQQLRGRRALPRRGRVVAGAAS